MSTAAYVDLMFAWGHARLGDVAPANELRQKARAVLGVGDVAHQWLLSAFEYRIEQAIEGQPHGKPWPESLSRWIHQLDEERTGASRRYVVDRFRDLSSILEPYPSHDTYGFWKSNGTALQADLTRFGALSSDDLTTEFARLKQAIETQPESLRIPTRLLLLSETARQYARLTPELAEQVFQEASHVVQAMFQHIIPSPPREAHGVLGLNVIRLLDIAGIVGQHQFIKSVIAVLVELLKANLVANGPFVEQILPSLFKAIRRLELRAEGREFLNSISTNEAKLWPSTVDWRNFTLGLEIARCESWLGQQDSANQLIEQLVQCFDHMCRNGKPIGIAQQLTQLVEFFGETPIESSRERILQLIRQTPNLPNSFTTAAHFSRLHTTVTEAAILAVTTDDFSSVPELHQRLGPDELQQRREFLPVLREQIIAWGEKGWNSRR